MQKASDRVAELEAQLPGHLSKSGVVVTSAATTRAAAAKAAGERQAGLVEAVSVAQESEAQGVVTGAGANVSTPVVDEHVAAKVTAALSVEGLREVSTGAITGLSDHFISLNASHVPPPPPPPPPSAFQPSWVESWSSSSSSPASSSPDCSSSQVVPPPAPLILRIPSEDEDDETNRSANATTAQDTKAHERHHDTNHDQCVVA